MILKSSMTGENVGHRTFVSEDKPPYEKDEFEIGAEGDNNDFFHVNESAHADLDYINSISYTIETDEDGNEYYDGEVYDNDGHHLDFFYGDREDVEYYFQDNLNVAEKIINKDAQKRGNFYWIEDLQDELVSDMNVDINNVDSVNKAAKRLSKPNGASLFILTDGSVISFHDHAQIQSVCEGMTISKFLELGNIRCGGGNVVTIQLIQQPTFEQQYCLKRMLSNADEVFVDFAVPNKNDNMYPETIHSVSYIQPNENRVVNDIMYYFWEGIKPFGESKKEEGDALNESTFNEWFGKSLLVDENGLPIKMYHGTDAVFNEFSKDHIGGHGSYEGYGFNFTPFESRARGYSSENVIEAYLRVENPMTTKSNKIKLPQLIKIMAELDSGKPFTDTIVAAYEPAGYGEKWDERYYRRALPVAARTIYNFNKENEYGDAGIYAEICLNGNADKIKTIEVFEKLGYDSVLFYDNDGRLNTAVVFEPNQIKRTTNKTFSNDSNVMDENLEAEVEASEVNLDSFKKRETLAPKIWDGFDLNPKVRLKLLDIADDFWDFANITWVKRSGIHLTGSICNFNWSKFSDIDLHIVVDFSEIDERKDFVQEYFDGKKNEWNNEHSKLKIYGFPVELYVEDINAETASGGLYDLEQNDWIKKPSSDNIKPIGLDKYEIKSKSAKLMTSIDDLYDEFNSTDDDAKLREIGEKAHKLLNKIKRMRKFGLQRNGESDALNVIYKVLRRSGYMEMLWGLSSELYDKINSLGINESLIKEDYDIFELAKQHFGITNDIRECGYILPDGSMLDFSGTHERQGKDSSFLKGRRSVDHREIESLKWKKDGFTRSGIEISMPKFIKMGAIRIHASSTYSTINLYVKPTEQQIDILLRIIRYSNGCVVLEIGDGYDESLSYAEYDNAKPRKIVNDIIRYFDEGINLIGNVSESKVIGEYYKKFISINEEIVADGSAEHNPFKERWKHEREMLKNYLVNYGEIMTSKENGKEYKVLYDSFISGRLGTNFCICIQWNSLTMEPGNVIYVRAYDKFTKRRFKPQFDTRGYDNQAGTADDVV